MSEWKMKRFWSEVTPKPVEGGFAIELDGRGVKTPAKTALIVPNAVLAERVAQEWRAVEAEIDPSKMPYTRSANAAIDKVAVQHSEVAGLIADYAGTDLLCYRAESPIELQERQAAAWDGALDWARERFGLELSIATGVMPVRQADASLARALELCEAMSAFSLTAFHDLVSMSGSFVLGLRAAEGCDTAEKLWNTSRIDETWQEEQRGVDDEASEMAALKMTQFRHAYAFYHACVRP